MTLGASRSDRGAVGGPGRGSGGSASLYEPLLEAEREAVADLLHFLENRDDVDFFKGEPLRALSTLSFSENVDLQRSAALALVEITAKDVSPVSRDAIDCGIFLLQSNDLEVQRAAAAAIGNLAVIAHNQQLIVACGALEPLVKLMESSNAEVQCNAVGCITNLATHDENKGKIARSGSLTPLTRLAKSKDLRVQRNATGALLNMTHTLDNRQHLVSAGALPILVSLLTSTDFDVQYYAATSLSNLAVDAIHRRRLSVEDKEKVVGGLIALCESHSSKVQCQAALALRNLASDEVFQHAIVVQGGLPRLLTLLRSATPQTVLAAVACARNISILQSNELPMLETGFIDPLLDLLGMDMEEVQCHAMSTIRNLVSSPEPDSSGNVSNETVGISTPAGIAVEKRPKVIERVGQLLRRDELPVTVAAEMTACLAVLALMDELKPVILKHLKALVFKTSSPCLDVKANAAAAIGNLAASRDTSASVDAETAAAFLKEWVDVRGYLFAFLASGDPTLQHISVWTLIQFVMGPNNLREKVENDLTMIESVRQIAAQASSSLSLTENEGHQWKGPELASRLLEELDGTNVD